MLLEFESKVVDFLKSIQFPCSGSKVLLAVSGGSDSIALLYVLDALKSQNVISYELYCAHINHQLRAEHADSDEEYVISQAQKRKIPVTAKSINVRQFARENKLSIETAARQVRIENLIEIAKANNCTWIATGHQKDDNAETVIHRLLRGTGYRGLAGIWPIKKFGQNISFVRPLLCVTRQEIVRYLQQRNLKWCEDHTNSEYQFTRNHIRHKLLPLLQKDSVGSLTEHLTELSANAGRFYQKISLEADTLWFKIASCKNDKINLKSKIFQSQSPPIQIELIRRALVNIGCGERDLTSRHYERILQLTENNVNDKVIQLPGGFAFRREGENILFSRSKVGLAPSISYQQDKPVSMVIPGRTTFDKFSIRASIHDIDEVNFEKFKATKTSKVEWFDLDKIKLPLKVRFRQAGDRFVPLGHSGDKRIGKFLTAQHVPHEIRTKALIVSDSEKVIWLWPVRISEEIKVTTRTQKILQLRITLTKNPCKVIIYLLRHLRYL